MQAQPQNPPIPAPYSRPLPVPPLGVPRNVTVYGIHRQAGFVVLEVCQNNYAGVCYCQQDDHGVPVHALHGVQHIPPATLVTDGQGQAVTDQNGVLQYTPSVQSRTAWLLKYAHDTLAYYHAHAQPVPTDAELAPLLGLKV